MLGSSSSAGDSFLRAAAGRSTSFSRHRFRVIPVSMSASALCLSGSRKYLAFCRAQPKDWDGTLFSI